MDDRKPTAMQILVTWLHTRTGCVVKSHEIETDVVKWGQLQGVMHSGSNYSRRFRELREDRKKLASLHLSVTPFTSEVKSAESSWKVEAI